MNEDASLWVRLGADANGDGRFTISDIGSFALDILILPGDAFLYLLLKYAPGVAEFFELGSEDYGGVVAIWAAVLIWLAAVVVVGTVLSAIRDLDRRLTSWALGRYAELKRLLRVLRRRVTGMISLRWRRKRPSDGDLVVETVTLARIETAVLRCLSSIEDGDVLTIDEIAARLNKPKRPLEPVIRRLVELDFIVRDQAAFTNKKGHRILTAGQMYLLGA